MKFDAYDILKIDTTIVIFIVVTCFAAIVSFGGKNWRRASGLLLIFSTAMLLGNLFFSSKEIVLYKYLTLSKIEVRFAMLLCLLNILTVVINGIQKYFDLGSSILSSFMLIFSIFILGTSNLIAFFVFIEALSYIMSVLPQAIEISIKSGLSNTIVSTIFFIGVGIFYMATGRMGLENIVVGNEMAYRISIVLLLTTMIFKIGLAPLNFWVLAIHQGISRGQIISYFFTFLAPVIYVFTVTMQTILAKSSPAFHSSILLAMAVIFVTSNIYGNIMSLAQRELRKSLSYNGIAQISLLAAVILLSDKHGNIRSLMYHLVITMLSLSLAFSVILELWAQDQKEKITFSGVKRYFVASNFGKWKFIFAILILTGAPLSGVIVSRALLFSGLISDGHLLVSFVFIISSVLGVVALLRFIAEVNVYPQEMDLLLASSNETEIGRVTISSTIMQMALIIALIVLGIFPSIFIK